MPPLAWEGGKTGGQTPADPGDALGSTGLILTVRAGSSGGGWHWPPHSTHHCHHATITLPLSHGGQRVCVGLRLPGCIYVPITPERGGSTAGPCSRGSERGGSGLLPLIPQNKGHSPAPGAGGGETQALSPRCHQAPPPPTMMGRGRGIPWLWPLQSPGLGGIPRQKAQLLSQQIVHISQGLREGRGEEEEETSRVLPCSVPVSTGVFHRTPPGPSPGTPTL